MGKVSPDAMLDSSLDYVAECDLITVCTSEPTSYNEAILDVGSGGYKLADIAVTPGDGNGDFTVADDAVLTGRKLTIAAQNAVDIDVSGTALHVALTKSGDTTLRFVTTCTSQALTAGGTVDLPEWKITIADAV